jgi:hypothetical protein
MLHGTIVHSEEAKAHAIFSYFDNMLGTPPPSRTNAINLEFLDLLQIDPVGMDGHFTEEEVWSIIRVLPPDKAPRLDDFTARFLQVAWDFIQTDLMAALDVFWHRDSRLQVDLRTKHPGYMQQMRQP